MKPHELLLGRLRDPEVIGRLRTSVAIVLEKIAYGGGATNWYVCRGAEDLDKLAVEMRPRNLVTFYFGGDMSLEVFPGKVRSKIEAAISKQGQCIVGKVGMSVRVEGVRYIDCQNELEEFLTGIRPGETLMIGPFPELAGDDANSVTVILPDSDGVVRPHAY